MSGEPGSVKVRNAMFVMLQGVSELTWFNGRSDAEPVREDQRPAGVLRFTEIAMDTGLGGGLTQHDVTFEIDLYADGDAFNDIADDLETYVSAINAALMADTTLGGLVGDVTLTGRTGSAESQPDVGALTLVGSTFFFTPQDDFNTVMGATAPIP